MSRQPIEIFCQACGRESILKREPVYEGFTRTGERLSCISCGHVFAEESEVRFKKSKVVSLFSEEDKPAPVHIFEDSDRTPAPKVFDPGENSRLCRYCAHYVVNPFVQRCAHCGREVEATDTCANFTPREHSENEARPTPGKSS